MEAEVMAAKKHHNAFAQAEASAKLIHFLPHWDCNLLP
jgi:hypothetical protein